MKLYPIEKGIPFIQRNKKIRKSDTKHRVVSEFPFVDMLVGDSFFVPLSDPKTSKHMYSKVNSTKQNYITCHPGMNFSIRKCTLKGVPGIRVWRIMSRKP